MMSSLEVENDIDEKADPCYDDEAGSGEVFAAVVVVDAVDQSDDSQHQQ
jgi:hypothetical protein